MDLSNLKLLIEKGPREGETFEFNSKPGFTVRIGRAARGNTIVIKDDGVSSKHLSIEWCSDGSKWEVKDLDSSNGTFLNSSALPPHSARDLRDGDELKIGEVTKLRVRISLVSDSQPVVRSLRSRARVLATANSDDALKVAKEGNRKGRGRGRGKGDVNLGNEGLGLEAPDSIASVAPEIGKGRGRGRGRSRGKGNAAVVDEEFGSEVSASMASVNKDTNLEDELELNQEITENLECVTQKGRPVSNRRTRSSKKEAGEVESKAESTNSLRRSTRSRGVKNKDNLALSSALERIPEASQLLSSVNCEGGQIAGESMANVVEEGEGLESGLISGQENCNELEFAVVKPEPQSNIGGIVGEGESVREIVQKDGDLVCELNFEVETVEEELEATLNEDDNREAECNVGATVSQESTADANALEKEAEAEAEAEAGVSVDLNKMTLGEWFDHLERILPKQIRAESDRIVQDMLNRSQQFNEFMLQKQKEKGTQPLG